MTKRYKVRVHETVTIRTSREVVVVIEATDCDHARALVQAAFPGMLPADSIKDVREGPKTREASHQASAGVEVDAKEGPQDVKATSYPRRGLRAGKCESCGASIFVRKGEPRRCKAHEETESQTTPHEDEGVST